jgi:hypothetical protein
MIKLKEYDESEQDSSNCDNCKSSASYELQIGKNILELCNRCLGELKWQIS